MRMIAGITRGIHQRSHQLTSCIAAVVVFLCQPKCFNPIPFSSHIIRIVKSIKISRASISNLVESRLNMGSLLSAKSMLKDQNTIGRGNARRIVSAVAFTVNKIESYRTVPTFSLSFTM